MNKYDWIFADMRRQQRRATALGCFGSIILVAVMVALQGAIVWVLWNWLIVAFVAGVIFDATLPNIGFFGAIGLGVAISILRFFLGGSKD